jgi:hypothetical protein
MNQLQMTREMIGFDNALPDSTFCAENTIWDQSAKIFTTVLNNANLLADDRGNTIDSKAKARKKKHGGTSRIRKNVRDPLRRFTLARLQEEHALWLK